MTDRKPIMCGPLELKWDHYGRWSADFRAMRLVVLPYHLLPNLERYGAWFYPCPTVLGDGPGKPLRETVVDTPELAAADLAKFLGEMAEALEPWRARVK